MSDIFGNNNFVIPCTKEVQFVFLAGCDDNGFCVDGHLDAGMKGRRAEMRRKGVNQSCLSILTSHSGETQAEC
ncbi:MAG: hypothetical protein IH899_10130 [Planctomycetes bacterium]|nr:hypothetical protein [Planctomycetota bacterium]